MRTVHCILAAHIIYPGQVDKARSHASPLSTSTSVDVCLTTPRAGNMSSAGHHHSATNPQGGLKEGRRARHSGQPQCFVRVFLTAGRLVTG